MFAEMIGGKMSNTIYRYVVLFLILALVLSEISATTMIVNAEDKNVLVITVSEEISSLNPMVGNSLVDWFIFNLIYDKLAIYDTELKPHPWLAESWEASANGTTWTIHLVRNATWHDGQPFMAKDVKFTIEYIKEHEIALWLDEVEDIESVETPDDYTVVIRTSRPMAYLDTYVLPRLPILPEHIWKDITDPEIYPNENPVGNGPFKLVEYKSGEYLRFVANENYWRGKPHIDEIIAKIGLSSDTAFLELKKGELDIMVLTPEYVKEVEMDPNLKVILTEDVYFDYIVLNTQRYPLSIKEFRQALSYAIDKQEIINRILLGYGEPLYSVIPPAYKFWHNPNVTKYEYDPDKAKAILDELGLVDVDGDGIRETPDGSDIEIEILTLSIWPPYVRLADMISRYWSNIGLKVSITAVEWGEESRRLHDRDYDVAVWGYTVAPEPTQFLSLFTNNPPPYWSMGEWVNETYNELLEQQKTVMNIEERRDIIYRLQEILAEELPIIPIWSAYVIEAYRVDRYTGWIPMPMGVLGIYNKLTWLSVKPVTQTKTFVTTSFVPGGVTTVPVEIPIVPDWVYAVIVVLIIVLIAMVGLIVMKKR